ncbi:hypothetical protein BU23DRAFT_502646 [Bimuria novae-zelandiae CBS 107.79]|uniref:Uncharacterized protein n=1 Tax=Bimuria novae-zelandiae CBS 107.79 TaxID=1447943 RepID=A0A6A5VFV4_9PLEO|nr:hypothetical protein BU23DRAFT_502646 [Bimuria novae-zelandiae CBS 107.79]
MTNYSYSYSYEAAVNPYANAQCGNTSPTRTHARTSISRRASTQKEVKRVDEADLALGRVFWLPPKEELPPRAVRRAHGKGAVEEGIYNHPVVVVSRPEEEPQTIHFHIVTSFQGKRLHEIYSKDNEFHASRRSWYLPISPSPIHPDATSKKMQKRFPTLELQHGATLRWDSYVNIRHVYKIDWALLRPYANPETPHIQTFRFDRESCDKMLAKTKILTNYEPGPQHQVHIRALYPGRAMSSPLPLRIPETPVRPHVQTSSPRSQGYSERSPLVYSPKSFSDEGSVVGSEYSGLSPILQSDFGGLRTEDATSIPVPRKKPPDGKLTRIWRFVMWILKWPLGLLGTLRERFRK